MPLWWAATAIGCVIVPLNAWLTKPELEWCVNDAGCKILVIDQERLDRLGGNAGLGLGDSAAPKGPVEHFILLRCKLAASAAAAVKSKGISAVSHHHLLDPTAPRKLPDVEISPFDDSQILYR